MKRFVLLCVAFQCILSIPAHAQRNWDDVEIKPHYANGQIHMLEGSGGNIGVSVGDDGILIVDDQFAPLADKIKAALRGLHSGDLKFVLNSHFHGDHTGGNPIFGQEATIVAHTNVRKRVSSEVKQGDTVTPPMEKVGWPVITFDEALSIHFNGEEIKLIHMPNGHTDTDAFIHFTGSDVIHLGDEFFNGGFPYVDLGSGGTVPGLVRNISYILGEIGPGTRVIPGHGALCDKEALKIYHAMLIETTDTVRSMMKDGKSLDDIKAAGLPTRWKDWGAGFITEERWIETIYNSYGME